MKKYLLITIAFLFAFVSCSKELNETPEKSDKILNLTFTSKKPLLKSDTKTAWNGSSIVWSSGDKIRVGYTLDGDWMNKNSQATNSNPAKFYESGSVSVSGDNYSLGTFNVPGSFEDPEEEGEYVFYSVYPSSACSTDAKYAPSLTLTLPTYQKPNAYSFDAAGDIMVGKSAVLSEIPSDDPISLEWNRIVAHGELTFKDFQGLQEGETISQITLTAQEGAALTGTFYANVTTGEITNTSHSTNTITISGTNLSFEKDDNNKTNLKVWMCILPVNITSLDIDVETSRSHYTRSISDLDLTFLRNARNTLGIKMGNVTPTPITVPARLFDDGDYLVTITHSSGGNKMMSAATTSPQAAVETSTEISDGKYLANKNAVWTITYNSEDGTYSFYSVGKEKYLSGNASATNLDWSDNPTHFKATAGSGKYRFTVTVEGNTRYLSYNYNQGNGDRFAMYQMNTSSSDYVFDLTLLPAQAKEEEEIPEEPKAGTDVLNYSYTGISGTGYAEWGPKKGSATNAYYIGQSGGQNSTIQLRTTNNNSGIVTYKSSGYVKKITVTWYSGTAAGRTLNIYGSNTAYSAATDLYNSSTDGDLVGTIVNGSSTTYTFSENYKYVGLRSNDGAMYLSKIEIEWGTTPLSTSPVINVTSSNPLSIASNASTSNAIGFTISNPTSGVSLTASTSTSWISNVTVSSNQVLFDVTENTTTSLRTGVITLSYDGADDVEVTIKQNAGGSSGSATLIIDGEQLTSTATTADTDKDYSGTTITFSDGAKLQTSSGDNKFTNKAILIGKSGKYIYNKTAIPGRIIKFEIYANKGASANVSVGVNFSNDVITSYNSNASNTYKATLSTLDNVYDCSAQLSDNCRYFWYQVTNSNNSQVEFRITYIPD